MRCVRKEIKKQVILHRGKIEGLFSLSHVPLLRYIVHGLWMDENISSWFSEFTLADVPFNIFLVLMFVWLCFSA